MITVRVCHTDDFPDSVVAYGAGVLPPELAAGIARYKFFHDQKVRTIARLLLLNCIRESGCAPGLLHGYRLDDQNKPFIPGWFCFNLSHSGQWVALAYGPQALGIDIEEVKPIETELFRHYLHPAERDWIDEAPEKALQRFYTIWSGKEAVLKADGIGILHDLQGLNTLEQPIWLNGQGYRLQPFPMPDTYTGFLATAEDLSETAGIDLRRVRQLDCMEG